MDLGYTSTIIPLVGERHDDRARVGSYLPQRNTSGTAHSGFLAHLQRLLSWRSCISITGVGLPRPCSCCRCSFLLLKWTRFLLFGSFVSLWPILEFYVPQSLAGVGRLATYIVLWIVGGLNDVSNGTKRSQRAVYAVRLRKRGRLYVEWPRSSEPEVNREVLNYILPAIPTFIFAAFQSQFALFLINAFGQTVT